LTGNRKQVKTIEDWKLAGTEKARTSKMMAGKREEKEEKPERKIGKPTNRR
jgi:hypothetical protein